jgi:hypothetical protein
MTQNITRNPTQNPTRNPTRNPNSPNPNSPNPNSPKPNSPGLSGMGWTDAAEMLNVRLAMIGFVLAIATELLTGQGVIAQIQALLPK